MAVEAPYELRRHAEATRPIWLAAYAHLRGRAVTDTLVGLLVETVHRAMLDLLATLDFRSDNEAHQPVVRALDLVRRYVGTRVRAYPVEDDVSLDGIVRPLWRDAVVDQDPLIWGEGTNACASDSKHFGAWDQNLTTQWHVRYGGRGVMIYWHVERKSLCIHSQLKSPSCSEVANMIEGVMRHCTELEVDRQYVDSHGQSVVAFAFTKLLGFQLLPRLKAIHSQRLYWPDAGQSDTYPDLQLVLSRPIDWELIRRQYDEVVKYATALRLGTAEAEAILRRFTRENAQHPTYKALLELGKAVKTVFLARYLHDRALRVEINDGLNVVEQWNSANDFIFFARRGEVSSNRREDQGLSMLSLHLLQSCMVYVNTLMIQQVLARPAWTGHLTARHLHALTPLFWTHVNPYGHFELDMHARIAALA